MQKALRWKQNPALLQFAWRFMLIWAVLCLLLAAIAWGLLQTRLRAEHSALRAEVRHVVRQAAGTVTGQLTELRGDVLFLASLSSLHAWLAAGTAAARTRLTLDFLAFAHARGIYDQVRYLNAGGREVVRIDWNGGHPAVVPTAALQDKARRYYVRDTLGLSRGQVYVSPFDLNIEHHRIEQPPKPMIRLGTPVYGPDGRKRGLVVLNFLGQRLLARLRATPRPHGSRLSLLNSAGYWLLAPRPGLAWGFMYPKRHSRRFSRAHPAVWKAIMSGLPQGQFRHGEDLYTYARLPLSRVFNANAGARYWVVLSRVPHAVLFADTAAYARGLGIVFGLVVLLLGGASALIAYYGLRRRQSQLEVRASEARFRGLLNAAPDGFVIVDEGGRIALVNEQTERWFGYSRDDLLGQPVEKLIPERHHEAHVGERDGYLLDPRVRPMGAGLDLHARHRDGSEFPVEISLSPLRTDSDRMVIAIVRDISARRRGEQARRVVEARYRELVDNLPVGVYRKTPGEQGRFLEVNPAMVRMLEAESAQELMTHVVTDMYPDPATERAFREEVIRKGLVNGREMLMQTLRGRPFHAAMSAVARTDHEGRVYFDGILEDVSERRENERRIAQLNAELTRRASELESINHELEAFSYSVSHDLRAPLRAMDGFSRILLDEYAERLDAKGRDRLERIRAATQRMGNLIDDLLELSRVSRSSVQREPVDLTALAQEVMEELRRVEPRRSLRFTVQPGLGVEADARLLRVVMQNLLGNAWKYTGKNAEAVIEVGETRSQGERVFCVCDNGVGFDMAYAGKLFGAFQRLHDASEFPGSGIGLATVQRIIRKHGGRIWGESEVGVGTAFYFTLQPPETS